LRGIDEQSLIKATKKGDARLRRRYAHRGAQFSDFAVVGAQLRARAQNILLPWLHQAQVTSPGLRRRRDARLWRDQGKRREAREFLAPVYGWFTEGFDTRARREAKVSLDAIDSAESGGW
jgi:hypothetical protein